MSSCSSTLSQAETPFGAVTSVVVDGSEGDDRTAEVAFGFGVLMVRYVEKLTCIS